MCLICVEYYYQRMTRDEVRKALPEMVMFAKSEEERNHYKKLQSMESAEELEDVAKAFVDTQDKDKAYFKVSYKGRRPKNQK